MKKIFLSGLTGMLIVITVIYQMNAPPSLMRKSLFIVRYGESLRTIARNLKKENLIANSSFFVYLSYILRRRIIKAGRYEIFSSMTSRDIMIKLTRGEVQTERVTIPEGFNLWQIAERLDAAGVTNKDRFLKFCGDQIFLRSIGIDTPSAEGYLFPDTYAFARSSGPRHVIAVMHRRMVRVIGPRLKEAGTGISRTHKILTIASLVEKEAKLPEERKLIASVFYNRLKKRMRLECDPTVRYAAKRFTGAIRVSDLKRDSPYNTYKRYGLPPGPICSPGRASIIAALDPGDSDFLYFVARNDGSHVFSKSLKEHNQAVRRYQR